MLEDKSGKLTKMEGLCRYDGKSIIDYKPDDETYFWGLLEDKNGNLWFGTEAGDPSKRETERGVWRYDGKTFKNFSKKDGLIHNGVWSILEDKAGNIWVGTRSAGLCGFYGKTFTSFSE